MYFLYNLALLLASPALAVILLHRWLQGKSRRGWSERWGHLPRTLQTGGRPRIWVHAASVGEVMAATPILRAYRELRPEDEIVMSVITPGGYEVAASLIGRWVQAVFYAPFDVPWAVSRVVRQLSPALFVVLETELWPNLLHLLSRSGARVVLVNGRLSDRSIGRYRRLRLFFAWVLSHFDRILVQTERDAERFQQIGASPACVEVLGMAKFDQATERLSKEQRNALRHELKLPEVAPVWVVGSTRLSEEERIVIEAYRQARLELPDLVLVHAPRHIERADEVAELMRAAGLHPVRRTALSEVEGPVEQLILDTLGELANVYAVADVAFLGNSLIPPGGGQNLLQALAQGKPVLYGKYTSNFRDVVAMAEAAGVGWCVQNAEELARSVVSLIRDREMLATIAERAWQLVQIHRGAASRYAQAMAELMQSL
jgi:3-deoxy-D-manno-octulosonic-acid transferase